MRGATSQKREGWGGEGLETLISSGPDEEAGEILCGRSEDIV